MEFIEYKGYNIFYDDGNIYVSKCVFDDRYKKYCMVSIEEAYEFIDNILNDE